MRLRSLITAVILSLLAVFVVCLLWASLQAPTSISPIKIITGSADHRIQMPIGITVNQRGDLYVTDFENSKVIVFNSSGVFISEFGKKGVGKGDFGLPWDIAVDSKGNVFVVDLALHRVQKFDAQHNFVWAIGSKGSKEGKFDTPFALAVDKQDNIYVLDTGNSRVQIFDNKGKFKKSFGGVGTSEGKFLMPSDLDIAPDGRIFVVDFDNSRVQIFDKNGRFLAKFGQAGSMLGDLAQPKGITIDQNNMVYVSDVATNYINVFDQEGNFLFRFGGHGAAPAKFRNPQKSCVDTEGRLYVADSQNNRVQVFVPVFHQGNYQASECFSPSCHDSDPEEFQQKLPHKPVESFDQCNLCHQLKNALGVLGIESEGIERAEVCVQCHTGKVTSRYLHGPLGMGECGDCHKPHGSDNPLMLFDRKEDLCFSCHPDHEVADENFAHAPARKGNCVKCHDPHGSEIKFFMQKETSEICGECHGQFKFPEDNYVHGPVAGGDCDVCHNPHIADNPRLLRKEGNALCFICHTESIIAKKNIHQPISEETAANKTCIVCHTPHQSKSKFQLREEETKLCYTCHKAKGEFDKKFKHGLKRQLDCSMCHDPHASNNNFLLKFKYPSERKNTFTEELYELCFQCHMRSLLTERFTTEKTNFRDGTKNLHYKHVIQKERNCNLCHDIHSSNNELLIREFKPYSKGPLSKKDISRFNFVANSNGGSCEQNNCHAEHISYNRLKSQ